MKIGIISDTHDRLPTFKKALEIFKKERVEAVFHAGDYVAPFAAKLISEENMSVPLYCIYGNNDGERAGLKNILPTLVDGTLKVKLGNKTIAMHHYIDWFTKEDIEIADIIISGHNHTAQIETRDNKLFINPGECCGWLTGKCTIAIADTNKMQAQIIDLGS